jgi:hypothetical protein
MTGYGLQVVNVNKIFADITIHFFEQHLANVATQAMYRYANLSRATIAFVRVDNNSFRASLLQMKVRQRLVRKDRFETCIFGDGPHYFEISIVCNPVYSLYAEYLLWEKYLGLVSIPLYINVIWILSACGIHARMLLGIVVCCANYFADTGDNFASTSGNNCVANLDIM